MSIESDAMPALGGSQARPWCSIVVRSTRCWRYRSDACRRVIRLAFSLAVQLLPLRSRLAFAVARLCHGASACLLPRPPITAKADSCIAAAFSIAIRRYSAGEHVPLAAGGAFQRFALDRLVCGLMVFSVNQKDWRPHV